ncbi:MAG: MFS transporter [Clostridia bacterium]|nr:MFS transporter [Clostridia bacterium]
MSSSTKNQKVKVALCIGIMCAVSYLAVYVARNILGAVTPQILADGILNEAQMGTLSSIYFITYAVGQLINGAIGDKISAKYMMSIGLVLAGISNLVFALVEESPMAMYIAYAATGFFLSMIYGPMTKVVAENVDELYVARCSLGYNFSSFFGSPAAGMLAAVLTWQMTFTVSSALLAFMGIVTFVCFTVFEKRGVIVPQKRVVHEQTGDGIKSLIQHDIIRFTLIAIITGVIRTTVVFWLPTYLVQYLGYTSETSAIIFTVATFIISFTAFISVFAYEKMGRRSVFSCFVFFIIAALGFALLYFVKLPLLNVVVIVVAIMASNASASILWSVYCPSLKDTGMVSSATGFIDFASYMAAAASSAIFGNAVSVIGWNGLILVWLGLMVFGIAICLPFNFKKKKA